ncbi:MAG: arylsulfatase [Cytophagales bacterium]|nr:arylsulfatase [Cytophagales bacterium]
MKRIIIHPGSVLMLFILFFFTGCQPKEKGSNTIKPNIIIFYVDDLGYGDIGVNGAKGVKTPNIDKLAREGINFTDAHSSAATCTPSRYSLLTGEYAFRNKAKILPGDAPLIISPDQPTLPEMLKKANYKTGVVGKWHLGLGNGNVDWNEAIKPGPLEIGFDYAFLIPATGDRVPTVYMENRDIVNLDPADPITVSYKEKVGDRPTGEERPDLLRQPADPQHSKTIINGISRIGYMAGGESTLWKDEDFPDVLTNKAFEFIQANKDNPFFLYYAFHDIHVPRLPHPRFQGKSEMGPRGDAIVQVDWVLGQVVQKLKELKLAENTLVIFTSDNGPVLNDGYEDEAVALLGDHRPGGIFRGGKYSILEAGTRMPTIASWPGTIQPGVNDALINQLDFYASFSGLLHIPLAEGEAPDSENVLPALLGKNQEGRKIMIEESFYNMALREGHWKYIPPLAREPGFEKVKQIEAGDSPVPQLFDLSVDPSENNNLAQQYPARVKQMESILESLKKNPK